MSLRLVKFVRLQHLLVDYVANVVTACPFAAESGLLRFILRSSLIARETDPDLLSNPVRPNRSRGDPHWKYTSTLNLSDILSLDQRTHLYKCIGLVDGYPICITAFPGEREEQKWLGIHASVVMPRWVSQRGEWEDGLKRCVAFEFQMRAGPMQEPW